LAFHSRADLCGGRGELRGRYGDNDIVETPAGGWADLIRDETVYRVMTVAPALRASAQVGTGLTGAQALRVLITLAGLSQVARLGDSVLSQSSSC